MSRPSCQTPCDMRAHACQTPGNRRKTNSKNGTSSCCDRRGAIWSITPDKVRNRHQDWPRLSGEKIGMNFGSIEIRRRHLLLERPQALGRRQPSWRLGNGQAIGRSVDGTASKRRPRSRSRPGSLSVRFRHRLFRVEKQPLPFGVRPDNRAWAGRRAW